MDFQPLILSTADLPAEDRDDLIHEFYGKIAQRLEIAPDSDTPFQIEVEALPLPGALVGGGGVSRMHGARTGEMRSDGNSDIVVVFCESGMLHTDAERGEAVVPPGDALLTAFDRPMTMYMPDRRNDFLSIQVSRQGLAPLVHGVDDLLTVSMAAARPELQLLKAYAKAVAAAPLQAPEVRAAASRHLTELTALAIGPTADAREAAKRGGVRAARLAAAKAVVQRNLSSPALSPSFVAARLGVSTRYLHMLFEHEPHSFADFVTERRLAWAAAVLADPWRGGRRIIDIALDAGFADVTTFNRAFRRRYGCTPSLARRTWTRDGCA